MKHRLTMADALAKHAARHERSTCLAMGLPGSEGHEAGGEILHWVRRERLKAG